MSTETEQIKWSKETWGIYKKPVEQVIEDLLKDEVKVKEMFCIFFGVVRDNDNEEAHIQSLRDFITRYGKRVMYAYLERSGGFIRDLEDNKLSVFDKDSGKFVWNTEDKTPDELYYSFVGTFLHDLGHTAGAIIRSKYENKYVSPVSPLLKFKHPDPFNMQYLQDELYAAMFTLTNVSVNGNGKNVNLFYHTFNKVMTVVNLTGLSFENHNELIKYLRAKYIESVMDGVQAYNEGLIDSGNEDDKQKISKVNRLKSIIGQIRSFPPQSFVKFFDEVAKRALDGEKSFSVFRAFKEVVG